MYGGAGSLPGGDNDGGLLYLVSLTCLPCCVWWSWQSARDGNDGGLLCLVYLTCHPCYVCGAGSLPGDGNDGGLLCLVQYIQPVCLAVYGGAGSLPEMAMMVGCCVWYI